MALRDNEVVVLRPASTPELWVKHSIRQTVTPRHPPASARLCCEPMPDKHTPRFLLDASFVLRRLPHNPTGWYLESANVPDHFVTLTGEGELQVLPYLREPGFDATSAFEVAQLAAGVRIAVQAEPGLCMQVRQDRQVVMLPLGDDAASGALFVLSPSDAPRERLRAERPLGTLQTRWGRALLARKDSEQVQSEYPRPMMVRGKPFAEWLSLNGVWEYAIAPVPRSGEHFPATSDCVHHGEILVPFCVESQLGGVRRFVGSTNYLWYRRAVPQPAAALGARTLLHFGAVDWEAAVYVNSVHCGTHRGGYTPFFFDITDALRGGEATLTVVVRVWDPTSAGTQPRGKQVNTPSGIWYTPTTGIWQTVWLETVPNMRVDSLECVPLVQQDTVELRVGVAAPDGSVAAVSCRAIVSVHDEDLVEGSGTVAPLAGSGELRGTIRIALPSVQLWSPDSPFLYDLRVQLTAASGSVFDSVESYFAMREVAVQRDAHGVPRLMLNGKPIFMFGALDQGYWPDGILTPPSEEAMLYDLELTKRCGMNAVRKHVKVESRRWYAACDRLGLLVWQDMPSGDRFARWDPYGSFFGTEDERTSESMANFRQELRELLKCFSAHPCIVCWVPFNEGWGRSETEETAAWLRAADPTRLVDAASGGNDLASAPGDVADWHVYPGPLLSAPQAEKLEKAAGPDADHGFPKLDPAGRALVLGEYGGLGLPAEGHLWRPTGENWGYRSFETADQLTEQFASMSRTLIDLACARGLCAAIYTQTTDVEVEVNGLVTYDRELEKISPDRIAGVNRELVHCLDPRAGL